MKRGILAALSLMGFLGLAEASARLAPAMFGADFANQELNRYNTGPEGIFAHDSRYRLWFMKPGFEARPYYNGYRWRHATDALGFRNPEGGRAPADVLMLGDSYVYGHGVEEGQTAARKLETILGVRVANLGIPGGCALHALILLRRHLEAFRPRAVVYAYFQNDIGDLYAYRAPEELERALSTNLVDLGVDSRAGTPDPARAGAVPARSPARQGAWASCVQALLSGSALFRAAGFAWERREQELERARLLSGGSQGRGPARLADPPREEESSVGWRFNLAAIREMARLSRGNGAEFVLVAIAPMFPKHVEILRRLAREEGFAILEGPDWHRDPSLGLPGDGHYSEKGHAELARALAGHFLNESPRFRPDYGNTRAHELRKRRDP